MHWLPNRRAPSEMSEGLRTAAVSMLTFSAPANSTRRMSSIVRSPPPTAKGMKMRRATARTTSIMMSSCAGLAPMS